MTKNYQTNTTETSALAVPEHMSKIVEEMREVCSRSPWVPACR